MAVASLCGNAGSKQSVGQVMPRASACRGWVCAPPTPCLQCAHSKTTGATRPPPRLLCAVHLPRTAGVGPVNGARGVRGALSIHPVHLPRTADAGPVDGVTPDQQGLPKDQRPSDLRNTGWVPFALPAIHAGPRRGLMQLQGRRVIALVEADYEDLEHWYPVLRLREEGVEVVVAGLGEPAYTGKHGLPAETDTTVDLLDMVDFDGILVVGGWAPDKLRRSEKVLELVR